MMARWYAGDFPVRKKKKPVKGEIKKKRPPSDE
jgi:hypothetical protein